MILMAQVICIIHLDLPNQAGDVVTGAGPLISCTTQSGGCVQFIAIIGNLGEVKAARSGACFIQVARCCCRIPAVMAVLPGGMT